MKYWKLLLLTVISIILVACSNEKKVEQTETEKEAEKATEKLDALSIQAPSGISIASPLYKILDDQSLSEVVDEVKYQPWNTPDELRARITSNEVQVSAVPSYVGANLYNKGMDIKLINTLVWGLLHFIGPDGETFSWEDLKGKTVYVPFKSDMPDLVFQYLLDKNGINKDQDITIKYASAPQEVVQLLAAGKAQYAILPEHAASLVIAKAKKSNVKLTKQMNLQEEWAKVTGKEARIPQAGIVVNNSLIEEHPEVVETLQKELASSIEFLNTSPNEAAPMIAKYQEGLEPAFIEKLIPSLNLEFVSAQDAKEELEFFFEQLATISPDIIGGQLPDDDFYYDPK
ncbi:ABC transporter substrate-binding protein [Bacillus sp. Hm123]|uniref:ABC transporter substrate-binding protein n=1 Tax=Bacillus sp. Hm123 TaxID=3450745 RepID=UPI003F42F08C